MKAIKFHLDDKLWERFFRIFPGHGERSAVLRKVVREIISIHSELPSLERTIAEQIVEDLENE